MKITTKTLITGVAAGLALAASATVASAGMKDYTGKTLKIVIPYGPGGTYDKYGVAFSNHLGKHLKGNPNIILQHMPGAGGAKAMNWFANVAPKDGMTMIVPLDNSVTNQLMRPKKNEDNNQNTNHRRCRRSGPCGQRNGRVGRYERLHGKDPENRHSVWPGWDL
jgi:tripartite-type tricarboxylate transporter receptor subunit TctC